MHRPTLLLLALGLASLAAASRTPEEPLLKEPAFVDDGRVEPLAEWRELACAECHAAVAEEWAGSLHGLAWKDEHYQDQLSKRRRKQGCYGCHIPAPLHVAGEAGPELKQGRPAPREEDLHFGISCESCHLGPDGAILGPWGQANDSHASVKSPSFGPESQSALCIACHQTNIGPVIGIAKDFVKTNQAERGLSCVGCHMAPVERPAAVVDGTPTEPRAGRSHALQGPRDPDFLRLAFRFDSRGDDAGATLVIENVAGHRIPGTTERAFVFELTLLDAAGEEVGSLEHRIDYQAALTVGEPLELTVPGKGGKELRVKARHELPGVEKPVPFLDHAVVL